jgi:hypothetical protein
VDKLFFLSITLAVSIGLQLGPASASTNQIAPRRPDLRTQPFKCSQTADDQYSAIREAEKKGYRVRRVEFVGNGRTRDGVLRQRVTLEEGDLFTRVELVKSLKSVSRLKGIVHPVRKKDVILQLDQPDKAVDMTICVRETRRANR